MKDESTPTKSHERGVYDCTGGCAAELKAEGLQLRELTLCCDMPMPAAKVT